MDGPLTRTSVTLDEAVAILLGWSDGPIEYTSSDEYLSAENQELLDNATFSLADELADRLESAESDLAEARFDGQPAMEIAERTEAIKKLQAVARLANTYRCAIADEINKGNQSGLRVDTGQSNSVHTYVTLTSLDEWARARCGKDILQQIDLPAPAVVAHEEPSPKPRTKLLDQEKAILLKINSLGYSPESLPSNQPGKSGVKARVKKALTKDPLFAGKTSFDKAWDRLRAEKSIVDAA